MNQYIFSLFLFFCLSSHTFGQAFIVPAPAQSEAIVVQNVRIHVGNGTLVENGAIAFQKGKITYAGPASGWTEDAAYQIIDGAGQEAFPGFIAPNTNLGLSEVNAVRATRDYREVGTINPSVRALIAYNTDSEITPTVRSNGVLLAQIIPSGGRISGKSSIVQLDAWNWEDAVVKADEGLHLNWPSKMSYNWREGKMVKNEDYEEEIAGLRRFLEEAKSYGKTDQAEKNLKLEAVQGLFDQSLRLYVHAQDVPSMQAAVLLAEEYGFRTVVVGGRDSWMIADFLKEKKVSVILRETQSLPGSSDRDIDQPFKTPAMLQEAGVLFCFSVSGYWQQRNLPFHAGQAVGYGLEYEEAVAALTLNTAKILGIDRSTGSIEAGKEATFFLSKGDALDMRGNQLTRAFIEGRSIDLNDKHRALYEKFKVKYDRMKKE
jgi:imidazolonepropionase-like amidohydrolase